MDITKRKALELTIQQWTAVGETEETALGETIWEWIIDNGYGPIESDSFLCEYALQNMREELKCALCPLLNKWDGERYCTDIGSPYSSWDLAYGNQAGKTAQAAAKRIVEICQQELEALNE